MKAQRAIRGLAGHQVGGREGAGVDHRIGPAVRGALDRRQRVEGQARAIDADQIAYRARTQLLAHQGEDEGLGHAHDRELVVEVTRPVDLAARGDHHTPNRSTGYRGQGRIDLEVAPS